MKDDKDTQPLSIYNRRDDLNDEPGAFNADSSEDQELRALFQRWSVPQTPASLDSRIITTYRQQILEHQEVLMKQCPTCQEEFANKFSFCPVDGTPLSDATPAIVASPTPDLPPMRLSGGASAATAALVPELLPLHRCHPRQPRISSLPLLQQLPAPPPRRRDQRL